MTPEQASSMATPDSRHHNAQRRGRPPFNTQQSSSVPSTPLQHPRDVRFSSRSPSPAKTLSANSPQSVASEAVGTLPPPRLVQPPVCKFEIGAEIKKRRIIYTEGGNEPLPPPSEEPKKHLDPHEDDKLTGDMRELYDRLLPTDESEERRVKLVQKLENILNNEWPGNEIKVNVFGSSGNLLSSTDSDGVFLSPSFENDIHLLTSTDSRRLHYDDREEVGINAHPGSSATSTYVHVHNSLPFPCNLSNNTDDRWYGKGCLPCVCKSPHCKSVGSRVATGLRLECQQSLGIGKHAHD